MVPFILIIVTIILVIVFKQNKDKFLKPGRLKQTSKKDKNAREITPVHQKTVGLQELLFEIPKLVSYVYIKGIPNYEVAHRMMAKQGNNLRGRLPFGSTDYQGTADPVYAKCIMADPSWSERVPLGHYIQDAGFNKPYGLIYGGGKYWKPASRITTKLLVRDIPTHIRV